MYTIVVFPVKQTFSSELTYFSPTPQEHGALVAIPLHKQIIIGVVYSCLPLVQTKSDIRNLSFSLKKMDRVISAHARCTEHIRHLTDYCASSHASLPSLAPRDLSTLSHVEKLKDHLFWDYQPPTAKIIVLIIFPTHQDILIASAGGFYDFLPNDIKDITPPHEMSFIYCKGQESLNVLYNKLIKDNAKVSFICTTPRYLLGFKDIVSRTYQAYPYHDWYERQMSSRVSYTAYIQSLFPNITPYQPCIPIKESSRCVFSTATYRSTSPAIESYLTSFHRSNDIILGIAPRKDYATACLCNDCNQPLVCDTCKSILRISRTHTHHQESQSLYCYQCKIVASAHIRCPLCKGHDFFFTGHTKERIEELFAQHNLPSQELFPSAPTDSIPRLALVCTPRYVGTNLVRIIDYCKKHQDDPPHRIVVFIPSLETLLNAPISFPVQATIHALAKLIPSVSTIIAQHTHNCDSFIDNFQNGHLDAMIQEEQEIAQDLALKKIA